jgi:hypothetical protein
MIHRSTILSFALAACNIVTTDANNAIDRTSYKEKQLIAALSGKQEDEAILKDQLADKLLHRDALCKRYASNDQRDKPCSAHHMLFCYDPFETKIRAHYLSTAIAHYLKNESINELYKHATKPELLSTLRTNEKEITRLKSQLYHQYKAYNDTLDARYTTNERYVGVLFLSLVAIHEISWLCKNEYTGNRFQQLAETTTAGLGFIKVGSFLISCLTCKDSDEAFLSLDTSLTTIRAINQRLKEITPACDKEVDVTNVEPH